MTAGPETKAAARNRGRQNGRIPERPRLVPGQQKCLDRDHPYDKCDGCDTHPAPHNRDTLPAVIFEQQSPGQPQREQKIDVQYQGVP